MPPCYFFFCLLLAPGPGYIPDGAGGYVPITNSRVLPDGSFRPYDPLIDGGYVGAPAVVLMDPPVVAPPPAYWVEPVYPYPLR